jgi:hypothetical protein
MNDDRPMAWTPPPREVVTVAGSRDIARRSVRLSRQQRFRQWLANLFVRAAIWLHGEVY